MCRDLLRRNQQVQIVRLINAETSIPKATVMARRNVLQPLLAAFVLLQAVGTYASAMNPAATVVSNVTATSVLDSIVEALGGSQLIGAIHGVSYTAETYDKFHLYTLPCLY